MTMVVLSKLMVQNLVSQNKSDFATTPAKAGDCYLDFFFLKMLKVSV